MPDRAAAIRRARALWARTASENEHEAQTARKLLDRYLTRHQLSLPDLGAAPAKGVSPPPTVATPPSTQPGTTAGPQESWRDIEINYGAYARMMAEGILRQQHGMSGTGTFADYTWMHFTSGPTFEQPPPGLKERMRAEGTVAKIHWWKQWGQLFAVLSVSKDATHVQLAVYGSKWDTLKRDHAKDARPLDLVEALQSRLQGTPYKLRGAPYPSVTELAGEFDPDWIELDPDTFQTLACFDPSGLKTMLGGIVAAARQFTAETKLP